MKNITFKPVLSVPAAAVALSACTMIPKYKQPAVNVPGNIQIRYAGRNGHSSGFLGVAGLFRRPAPVPFD